MDTLLKRDRLIATVALLLVMVLAWLYTIAGVGMGMSALEMSGMSPVGTAMRMGEMELAVPDLEYYVVLLAMWWIMMIAMMLPSASPTILLAGALNRKAKGDAGPFGSTGWFAFGYLLTWLGFSLTATAMQIVLEQYGLLSAMMNSNSRYLTATLLLAAGIWQFTPIKHACLRHCRSPVEFLVTRRRRGNPGAVRMGVEHGAYCVGCCWFLMALLFAGGVMNLIWIVGLALYVTVEKWFPQGIWFERAAGVILVAAGLAMLL